MYYLGIDVHKHDSQVAVVDDDGEIVEEVRVENANLEEIADEVPLVGFLISWVLSVLAQMLVMVFVLAISRYREYVADADAAEYTGDADALARALSVIYEVGSMDEAADVDATTASMCIFGGERGLLGAIFSTHPPMEKRVARLQAMAER